MAVKWSKLTRSYPNLKDVIFVPECCEARPVGEAVIFARIDRYDQRRGQPPFRYRCEACGPTQEDYQPRAEA